MNGHLERLFPGLIAAQYQVTSTPTPSYNCIAWAAHDTGAWWWPDPDGLYFWPADIPREESVDAFVRAYQTLGFSLCSDGAFEPAFEKVAIYVGAQGEPTHAARLLRDGWWTSKLGALEDIRHQTLAAVEGASYGNAGVFMKRPITGC